MVSDEIFRLGCGYANCGGRNVFVCNYPSDVSWRHEEPFKRGEPLGNNGLFSFFLYTLMNYVKFLLGKVRAILTEAWYHLKSRSHFVLSIEGRLSS